MLLAMKVPGHNQLLKRGYNGSAVRLEVTESATESQKARNRGAWQEQSRELLALTTPRTTRAHGIRRSADVRPPSHPHLPDSWEHSNMPPPPAKNNRALPPRESGLFKELLTLYETRQLKKAAKAADTILKKFPEHGGRVNAAILLSYRSS
jgi:hypothetical protein